MTKNIIWIASFPKSGNTWMRFFLNSLMHKKDEITSLDTDARISGACTAKGIFKEFFPENMSGPKDTFKNRPTAIDKFAASREGKKVIMKTHSAYAAFEGVPQIPKDNTLGAILVIRNPFDTLVSCMNHFGFDQEGAFNFLDKISSSINETDKHYAVLCANWDGFAQSWMKNATSFPLHVVRYEDMKSKPVTEAMRLNKMFNLKVGENEIVDAISATRFNKLKQLETGEGFKEASEKASEAGGGFFNRGEVGYFNEILTDDMIKRVNDRFGDAMKSYGYELGDDNEIIVKDVRFVRKSEANQVRSSTSGQVDKKAS